MPANQPIPLLCIAASLLFLQTACSKHDTAAVFSPPSGLNYSTATGVSLKGVADTSVTPEVSWNGKSGSFTLSGEVPSGVAIDSRTGKISWPSSLSIGSYLLSVVANNGSNVNDTTQYAITVSGLITTLAGDGSFSYGGDGGPASGARFNMVSDLTADAQGNLYIADSYNHRIRKIDASGMISTVAGTGATASTGDGGAAAQAGIYMPIGILWDSTGSMYITEYGSGRIRKIDGNGIITTLAGSDYSGQLNLGDEGPATKAWLHLLAGKVALDAQGSLYIADYGNMRVRKVTPDGIIHSIAGDGPYSTPMPDGSPALTTSVGNPASVKYLPQTNSLLIVNLFGAIYRMTDDKLYNYAGGNAFYRANNLIGEGGPALTSNLQRLSNIVTDKTGNIFFNDMLGDRILRIGTDGRLSVIAGTGKYGFSGDNGPAASAMLAHPYGLAIDDAGDLYIADTDNSRIRKVILH